MIDIYYIKILYKNSYKLSLKVFNNNSYKSYIFINVKWSLNQILIFYGTFHDGTRKYD